MTDYILALDQGTTSSRATTFDREGQIVQVAQRKFMADIPQPGWVEHDPEDLGARNRTRPRCGRTERMKRPGIAAIGITNQRETTIVWERDR